MSNKVSIGIDLGGTNIAVGLVNEKYEIVAKKSTPTGAERGSDAIVADMAKVCRELLAEQGLTLADVESVGIAAPGIANRETGRVEYSANLPFRKYPLADNLSALLDGKKVRIANDADTAAWGEAVAGASAGSKHSIMITLGTGVGGGMILNGNIYSGFNMAGGELGHIVIEQDGAQCGCGRKGCWEAYSSATALIRMTKEKIEECKASGRYTMMADAERVSGRTACDCMRKGDAAAKEVYDKYIHYLATGLTNIVNIFQPEVISLGGGVSGEGQHLIDDLMPQIEKERYGGDAVKPTEFRIAKLGNDAGIIGAAMLK